MIFGKKTVYNLYKNKTALSTDALFEKLKEISAGINYELRMAELTPCTTCSKSLLFQISKSR